MTNILLNYYNFDGDWARPYLERYIRPGSKVFILPLAYRPVQAWDSNSWLSVYGVGGEKYANIVRPFTEYGIDERSLVWCNPYDTAQDYARVIADSDILFFTGGMPERAVKRLDRLGLTAAVKSFGGVVAGASAGAMLQLDKYHITPDEDYSSYSIDCGLGLVTGLDLEVHFVDTPLQNECTARAARQLRVPVYQMRHEGGLLVEGGAVTEMGAVRKVLPPCS